MNTKKELQLAESSVLKLFKKMNYHIWYSKERQFRTIGSLYDYALENLENTRFLVSELKEAYRT